MKGSSEQTHFITLLALAAYPCRIRSRALARDTGVPTPERDVGVATLARDEDVTTLARDTGVTTPARDVDVTTPARGVGVTTRRLLVVDMCSTLLFVFTASCTVD